MSNPTAIITGAGRGIGRATAQALAAGGYSLALVARSAAEVEETARLCGNNSVAMPGDVRDLEAVEGMINQASETFGRIDALVHNAGSAPMRPIEQMAPGEWQATLDTNLSAAFYFCRGLWPLWRKQAGGVAVFVSSLATRDPFIGLAGYAAAKGGLNSLCLALAREGAPLGIRVHTIAPGAVETTMLRDIVSVEQLPTSKTLEPADVARVIAQCVCGDLRHTSGEVIYVHKTV
jgi:NAD(P)-dependent dehydrogenase (short-subunit alcohol dehydrogenase family)